MSTSDNRNIIDFYKGWKFEDIKLDLDRKRFEYAVLMEQFQGDYNIGTVLRNANAFGAKEVFYIGRKKWDRRGAVGTHNYTAINYLKSFDDLIELKKRYTFIGLDNIDGARTLHSFEWPKNSLMIFGEESIGITKEIAALCDYIVAINQYGSVRSLNAAVASGISMFDYTNKLQEMV